MIALLCLAVLFSLRLPRLNAHGGGLDAYGCHNDRARGNYHCHRGPLAGRVFASKAEAMRELSAQGAPADKPATVAPRAQASPPRASDGAAAQTPYSRDLYRHWIDEDGDCQDTRAEVLIAESLVAPQLDMRGCSVLSGLWFDPYTAKTFTDPRVLDIDHFVPLAEVHRSGGSSWTQELRQQYANNISDSATLIAVDRSANRSKGDKDPAGWLPSNEAYRCFYVSTWVQVKRRWGLLMDEAEAQAIESILNGCAESAAQ
ncbi:MAG: HNH endonuclease [Acidobacteria bacterium]|nr:HNH endonuclease [Acidobacteriota bacterium]